MQVTGSIFDKYVLSRFVKISRLAMEDLVPNPLWSSIVFEKENQRILYVGWNFMVELKYPVEESFIVNFQRFRDAIRSCQKPTVRTTKQYVMVEEGTVKFKLKKLDIDYSSYLHLEPKDLSYKEVQKTLLQDIQFCSMAASRTREQYTKYGVILGDEVICATNSSSNVAIIFTKDPTRQSIFRVPVLLQLPWCEILPDLGPIKEIALQDFGEQNTRLFIKTADDFKVTIPALKVEPNPSMIPFIESLEDHITLTNLSKSLLKKLEITTDSYYKFVSVFSENGLIFLESRSKVKGVTVIELCEGDMGDVSVAIGLDFLYKVVSLSEYLDLDLDNMVGFISIGAEDEYKYAFSLG